MGGTFQLLIDYLRDLKTKIILSVSFCTKTQVFKTFFVLCSKVVIVFYQLTFVVKSSKKVKLSRITHYYSHCKGTA